MADDDGVKQKSRWPGLVLFSIVFLPGAVFAGLLWSLFRFGRQRASVVAGAASTVGLISAVVLASTISSLGEVFGDLGNIGSTWSALILPWVSLSLIFGGIVGAFVVAYEANKMKRYPYLTELDGDWRSGFRYARTPLQVLARRRNVRKLKDGSFDEAGKAPLGLDEKTDEVASRYAAEARRHTMITGGTGSGKSITMQSLIQSDIVEGNDVVVIDFKRSPEFASKLAAWAADNGREFYHFVNGDPELYDIPRSKGQCYYDPLKSGSPTSKADMVLGMREYDTASAVYKMAAVQLNQAIFGMLHHADRSQAPSISWNGSGIEQLASITRGNGFGELAAACTVEMAPEDPRPKWEYTRTNADPAKGPIGSSQSFYMNTPIAQDIMELMESMRGDKHLPNAKGELQGQIRTISTSEYGRWMKLDKSGNGREIDLFKLTQGQGNVILFSLNSDSEPEFAKFVGSLVFSDLTNVSARRRNEGLKNQVNIYADEFQAVPPGSVKALLEKARESAMTMTLALQSFDQVVAAAPNAGEAYLNAMIDTCGNFIAHAGSGSDSATRLSNILGKRMATVYSKSNDNDSSFLSFNWSRSQASSVTSRQEERWLYAPTEFMSLESPVEANRYKSTAVFVTKTSSDPKYAKKGGATARTIWMVPARAVLEEYYMGPVNESAKRSVAPASVAAQGESIDDSGAEFRREGDVQPVAELHFGEQRTEAAYHDANEGEAFSAAEPEDTGDWELYSIPESAEEEPAPLPTRTRPVAPPSKASDAFNGSVADLFNSSQPANSSVEETFRARPPRSQGVNSNPTGPTRLPQQPNRGLPQRPRPVEPKAPVGEDFELPEL